MSERIDLLCVGGGWVDNVRHIPALLRSGLYNITGVVSAHPDRAARTAKTYNLEHQALELDFSQDWQDKASAVMIGSTPHTHYEIAKTALEAGKHVLTEKPMTIEVEHADELRQLAEDKGLTLALVHNFQFSRASQCFRKDAAAGKIGKVKAIYGAQLCNHARNIHDWCDELPLGLFYDEAPHFYYMLRWLGGGDLELRHASVWKSRIGINTAFNVTGEYNTQDDIPIYLHVNFDSSITEWNMMVVGEKATAILDLWRDIYIYLPNDGAHGPKEILRTAVFHAAQNMWGVFTGGLRHVMGRHLYGNVEVVTRFYRAIHGEDCLQGMDAAEGKRVIEMMHEIIAKADYH